MSPESSVLLTDHYQLTMLQAYFDEGMDETAAFEFFVRDLPSDRSFLLAAGLEQALDYLENLRFTLPELEWLEGRPEFTADFIEYLEQFRFAGDVDAMPEGTVCFANEPLLRVTAPLPQAQLVESRLINLLQFETMVAAKAARVVLAGPGKHLVDFGFRRAHGAEAGVLAARAAYLAGFDGTATVLAGARYNIPVYGTMAHSYILAHDSEEEAFLQFARSHPENVTLLIDTYDTEAAARKLVAMAPRLKAEGIPVRAVRIDSGDLADLAHAVRRILDEGGLEGVGILTSGDLDEYAVARYVESGTPIDSFGVGTRLVTSADAPYLHCAYKLEEYDGRPRRKRSPGKANWPGRKQVYRRTGEDGHMAGDLLALEGEAGEGEALLQPVMRGGKRIAPSPSLAEVRERAGRELARLPDSLRRLEGRADYRVTVSPGLRALTERLDEEGGSG